PRERRDPANLRLGLLAVVGMTLFAALFFRLWYLQVLSADTFVEQAQANQVSVQELPATRGRILDRNGVVLAENDFVSVVSVDERLWTDPERDRRVVVDGLSELLHMEPDEVEAALDDTRQDPLLPKVIKDDVAESARILVEERRLPGVSGELRAIRSYPFGDIAAHVLGYTGVISEEQLAGAGPEVAITAVVGKAGVEAVFEEQLRGTPGRRLLEINRVREVIGQVGDDVAPEAGGDLYLTLDVRLQQVAEQAIEDELANARQRMSTVNAGARVPAPAGSAVVLDLRNGDVLALASYPDYDPNWLISGLTRAQYDERFLDTQVPSPLTNRAIRGLYAPGSTFKLITSIAGIRAGTLEPGQTYHDQGYFEIPDADICDESVRCRYLNAGGGRALGYVDLDDALTASSDAYFYRQGYLLDRTGEGRQLQATAADFGFGSATGIQLPFEQVGRIPSAVVKAELAEEGIFSDGTWLNGDNINFAVGQGFFTATPLQLANAYAAWANGGTLLNPNIVDRTADRVTGDETFRYDARVAGEVSIPPGNDAIVQGLAGVPRSARGTAAGAFSGYDFGALDVLGKTGTAQADGTSKVTGLPTDDTAAFVGVAPREDPRYVVVVVLEEAGFGGDAAAPAARAIFEELARIEADDGVAAAAPVPPPVEEVECSTDAIVERFGTGTAIEELGLDTVARILGCDPDDLRPLPAVDPTEGGDTVETSEPEDVG
ncbi:MAG TPA: penicillin-binding protein 2, partial [Acidimicrobiia bacterium]|nr:penicillin-binding protein 2 [Acidimicrobiia bacterium]